jgi:hypothetical protein
MPKQERHSRERERKRERERENERLKFMEKTYKENRISDITVENKKI